MENINKNDLHCKLCNYTTNKNLSWLRHIESEKHKHNGIKLKKKCDTCDYESFNKWHLIMHNYSSHYTKEQRENEKNYCNLCDIVFISESHLNKHLNGRSHIIKQKVIDSYKDMETKFNELNP